MPRVLVIDDDRVILMIVRVALTKLGYEVVTASKGMEGLHLLREEQPDIIVTDKMMPDITGIEVTRRIRTEPRYAHIPILMLTAEAQIEDKMDAFEAGADDYLSKPFEAAELAARLSSLLRRAQSFNATERGTAELKMNQKGLVVAVHSLRGGVGCSTLLSNLAVGVRHIWRRPTLLVDTAFSYGQAADLLGVSAKRSLADLAMDEDGEFGYDDLSPILNEHSSGLELIASPSDPQVAHEMSADLVSAALAGLQERYDYLFIDTPHDFSETTVAALNAADKILLMLAPEVASIRAAGLALTMYKRLEYPADKILLVLSHTFERSGFEAEKIESILKHPIVCEIPYAPHPFLKSINRGAPILDQGGGGLLETVLEDFAYHHISQLRHRSLPPAAPTDMWHRITQRAREEALPKRMPQPA